MDVYSSFSVSIVRFSSQVRVLWLWSWTPLNLRIHVCRQVFIVQWQSLDVVRKVLFDVQLKEEIIRIVKVPVGATKLKTVKEVKTDFTSIFFKDPEGDLNPWIHSPSSVVKTSGGPAVVRLVMFRSEKTNYWHQTLLFSDVRPLTRSSLLSKIRTGTRTGLGPNWLMDSRLDQVPPGWVELVLSYLGTGLVY